MTPQEQRSTTEVDRIRDQFRRAFDGEAWHGPSVLSLLDGISAQQAAAYPITGAHSIWELTLHIAAWERACLRRLHGDPAQLTDTEDWQSINDTSEAAWESTKQQLIDNNRELLNAIANVDESRLNEPITDGSELERLCNSSWWRAARSISRRTNSYAEEGVGELMSGLSLKDCVPCRGGVPPLQGEEIAKLLTELEGMGSCKRAPPEEELSLFRLSRSADVCEPRGDLAEEQGHHPDICFGWGQAEISIWTHKINGLTESDFILAAKIDKLT